MKKELWKRIKRCQLTNYYISNIGNVKNIKFKRVLAGSLNRKGYLAFSLYCPCGKTHTAKCHVLVAQAFIGPKPTGLTINHIDGIKTNNSVSNLEYVTNKQNMQHAFAMGLVPRKSGSEHHNSKLTQSQVEHIKTSKIPGATLARKYGVSRSLISMIRLNRCRA